ncbi:MAG: hypothetical protein HFF90_02730 [Oscillibacter sp.]|nr:hypothetical protein [Oscillibacter sp.]
MRIFQVLRRNAVVIVGVLMGLVLLAGLWWNYSARQAERLYGTYSLSGSMDTRSEFLTLPGGDCYVRYQNGELLSRGTIKPINGETPLYEFLPDGGADGEIFVLSGGVLYQALGEEFHFFQRIDKRPVYINYSPRSA